MKKILSIIIIVFAITSCSLSGFRQSVVDVNGFDFSAGGLSSDYDALDIVLSDSPFENPDERSDSLYYFDVLVSDQFQFIKDYGLETFNYLDRVPQYVNWDSLSPPIKVDHLYLIRCKDGYVKLKIMQISGSNLYNVVINFIYSYTSGEDF